MTPQFLRIPQVQAQTGLARSTIYLYISKGLFPAPIPLGSRRAVGWLASDVTAWVERQVQAARGNHEPAAALGLRVSHMSAPHDAMNIAELQRCNAALEAELREARAEIRQLSEARFSREDVYTLRDLADKLEASLGDAVPGPERTALEQWGEDAPPELD